MPSDLDKRLESDFLPMKVFSIIPRVLILTLALVAGMKMARADESVFSHGSNPVLGINLIGFDPTNGELRARMSLKLPKSDTDP